MNCFKEIVFTDELLQRCRNKLNKPHNIPNESKNKIKSNDFEYFFFQNLFGYTASSAHKRDRRFQTTTKSNVLKYNHQNLNFGFLLMLGGKKKTSRQGNLLFKISPFNNIFQANLVQKLEYCLSPL